MKSLECRFLGRRKGSSENVFIVEGNVFDASLYVDVIRSFYQSDVNYLIIEPVRQDLLLEQDVF